LLEETIIEVGEEVVGESFLSKGRSIMRIAHP
jgi:hypothetical protein